MVSLVDLTVATGIFFVFVVIVLVAVLTYYTNFLDILEDSELRTSAANVKNIILGGKGVPTDWETSATNPVRLGLTNDLFRIPVIVAPGNESSLDNATVNFTISFDSGCTNTTRENTVRVYNETGHEYPYTLYNKTFCIADTFLKSADFAVNLTLPAATGKLFFVYFSPETDINLTNYGSIAFPILPNSTNYTAVVYPREDLEMVSPSKVRALRNLTFEQIIATLGGDTRFELEVDKS